MAGNSADKARALEQCERDLDVAIERLVNLRLDAADHDSDVGDGGGAGAQHRDDVHVHPATAGATEEEEEEEEQRTTVVGAVHVPSDGKGIGIIDADRAEWIERVVGAMASAGNWGDARARVARLLEGFGASVSVATARQRAERDVALRRQNSLLKAAVRVQRRMCVEKEAANRELQRQLAACQDRVRGLETDNYALAMYLRNSLPKPHGGDITGRFHPEVF